MSVQMLERVTEQINNFPDSLPVTKALSPGETITVWANGNDGLHILLHSIVDEDDRGIQTVVEKITAGKHFGSNTRDQKTVYLFSLTGANT